MNQRIREMLRKAGQGKVGSFDTESSIEVVVILPAGVGTAQANPSFGAEPKAPYGSGIPFGPITLEFVINYYTRTDRALEAPHIAAAEAIGDRPLTYAEHTAPGLGLNDPPIALSIFTPNAALLLDWAVAAGAVLISVEYRRAPEHPQPVVSDDCFAALKWVQASAGVLGINAARILVAGQLAGSGLAAGLALRARDVGLNPLVHAQMLPCPMLDDRCDSISCAQFDDGVEPWDRTKNAAAWAIALGERAGARTRAGDTISS
ncbi:alpha/beta hydrolase fold-3 domain-containing protein [Colletotrichum filicis]|nr:alpha/beta hydrolase fold-3 domain-containing protein [Colletotrichum filicis]